MRKPSRVQPETVPTDTIMPLSCFDSSWMLQAMITNWSFRFHDVLDADMLHQSLVELISNGENWGKLGGRFRLNVCKILSIILRTYSYLHVSRRKKGSWSSMSPLSSLQTGQRCSSAVRATT